MVATRTYRSVWASLVLLGVSYVVACEGESTTGGGGGDAGDAGEGGKGGSSGAATGGSSAAGSGGASGSTGKGGSAGKATGGASGTTTGGTAGESGAGGGAGEGGDSQGGSPGDGGSGGAPDDRTVRGRVIDFWQQPLSGVPVTIGTVEVTSGTDGTFTIEDVAPTYDVSLLVTWSGGQAGVYGWRFEGLTRRDPTLQVYKGRTDRSAGIQISPQGAVLDSSRVLSVALAGAHGSQLLEDVGATGVITSTGWVGPMSMPTTAHALLWEIDSNELPTVYRAYDATMATLVDATTGNVFSLNVADESITQASISGTITSPSTRDRENHVFVRFAGGASIGVVNEYPPPDAYSYVLPSVPSSSVTVAASYGYWLTDFSLAHRDGLAPGQSGVSIEIPEAPTQTVPGVGASNVGPNTQFSWSSGGRTAIFHVEDVNYYQGLYVVTNRQTTMLPSFGAFSLRPDAAHYWQIEIHGNSPDVDAFTGPQGGLDAFSYRLDRPDGPKTGDGSYSSSPRRAFTTAP